MKARRAHAGGRLLVLAGLLTAAVGCSAIAEQAAETAVEQAAGGDVEVGDDGVSVEGGNGDSLSLGAADEVPPEISELVTLPEGFAAETAFETTQSGSDAIAVTGSLTDEDPQGVIDDIEAQLVDRGWETFNKGDIGGEMFSLMVQGPEQAVTANIIVEGDGPANMTLMLLQQAPD